MLISQVSKTACAAAYMRKIMPVAAWSKNGITIVSPSFTNTVYIHISLFFTGPIELCYFSTEEFTFKYHHFEDKGKKTHYSLLKFRYCSFDLHLKNLVK